MKFLGNISHLANSGKLIVKTTKTPPAGAFVFTNDKQKIGKVYSIFGPVKNPYVKWKRWIEKIRTLSLKRVQKLIPEIPGIQKILEVGNLIQEKEETNSLI